MKPRSLKEHRESALASLTPREREVLRERFPSLDFTDPKARERNDEWRKWCDRYESLGEKAHDSYPTIYLSSCPHCAADQAAARDSDERSVDVPSYLRLGTMRSSLRWIATYANSPCERHARFHEAAR